MSNQIEEAVNTLEKNLNAIKIKQPTLEERLRESDIKVFPEFLQAASGDLILKYRGINLHNNINPIKEADASANGVITDNKDHLIIVYGLGLGYLFKHIYDTTNCRIIVVEPYMDVLKQTLEVVDFSQEFADPRVFLSTCQEELRYQINSLFIVGDSAQFVALTAYKVHFNPDLADYADLMSVTISGIQINQNTVLGRAKNWIISSIKNMVDMTAMYSIEDFQNSFKNKPAVIVSAGPSVDKAIDYLKKVHDKVVIICVGQALRSLHKAGIKPDLTVAVENIDITHQFEDVTYLDELTLCLQAIVHENIYKLPVKNKLIHHARADIVSNWFNSIFKKEYRGFNNRGSVAFSAFYDAVCLGCNPIILIGQDLAYSEGKCYADGSSNDGLKYTQDEETGEIKMIMGESYRKNMIEGGVDINKYEKMYSAEAYASHKVMGQKGEMLITNGSYKFFIEHFGDLIMNELQHLNVRFINASVGGAYLKGFEHMSLEEALSEYTLTDINFEETLENVKKQLPSKDVTHNLETLLKEYNTTLSRIAYVGDLAEKATEYVKIINKELEKKFYNQNYVLSKLKKLNKIDKELLDLVKDIPIISPFIQKELFDFARQYARYDHETKDELDSLKENMKFSGDLYRAILTSRNEIQKSLKNSVERVSERLTTLCVS